MVRVRGAYKERERGFDAEDSSPLTPTLVAFHHLSRIHSGKMRQREGVLSRSGRGCSDFCARAFRRALFFTFFLTFHTAFSCTCTRS